MADYIFNEWKNDRVFDGQVYEYEGSSWSRSVADNRAWYLRRNGYNARVIEGTKNKRRIFHVYKKFKY